MRPSSWIAQPQTPAFALSAGICGHSVKNEILSLKISGSSLEYEPG